MSRRIQTTILSLAILGAFFLGCAKNSDTRFVTLGTGGMTGVYYPTGRYIARMVNQKKSVYRLSCTHEATGGSVFNINAVLSGDMMFGIAQSDRQYQAVEGLAEWTERGKQAEWV